ncbi:hypothetical protein [Pedobacter sp. NJ-S-72]
MIFESNISPVARVKTKSIDALCATPIDTFDQFAGGEHKVVFCIICVILGEERAFNFDSSTISLLINQ